jgi:hypothetical protein
MLSVVGTGAGVGSRPFLCGVPMACHWLGGRRLVGEPFWLAHLTLAQESGSSFGTAHSSFPTYSAPVLRYYHM